VSESYFPKAEPHAVFMQRCLSLAQQAVGRTAPNPMVGAVIVNQNRVVGEGFHPQAGAPHAEVMALRAAGAEAQGATLYVNLEPCNHTGRTPPCTEAILQAGIQTVVIGMADPNPQATGGAERLRAAGLTVISGIEATACEKLNEAFTHCIRYHRPFGIFKYAMTLDGKIATTTGHSSWITSPTARQRVHQLRGSCDAVIVGGNTVRQDNPHLTTHGLYDHSPLRIVMSRQLNLPRQAHLWDTETAPTLVFTEDHRSASQANGGMNCAFNEMRSHLEQQGVEVIALPQLSPATVMAILYQRGLLSVLWECGGNLAAAALQAQVIQKIWAFIAPKLVGGQQAPTPIGDLGITHMEQALLLKQPELTQIGPDWLIEGYLEPES
jgi:diaminohydroxyphosphoribosylaminopyrimidine deaminase/5-amino-6-(5-phosphoribosylamino)uracil reductase